MSLDAVRGSKVVYLDEGGYDFQRERARTNGLVNGGVYTVTFVEVYSFESYVFLAEFPDSYNTVMFDDCEEVAR